jgi:hypothetical protein
MPTYPAISFQDGPKLTVSAMVKQPTLIPKRIINLLEQQFIVDALLRKLQPTQSGVYVYEESTPLFADGEAEIVEEFGEIPVVSGKVGARKVAFTVKRALGLKVSQEMINRNQVDRVNTQQQQIKNTMIRTWETVFFNALLNHPDVDTIPVTNPWSGATGTIRADIAGGMEVISDAAPDDMPDDFFGFEADTLVIGKSTKTDLITSDDFNEVYRMNPLAAQSPEYKGTLPNEFYGLKIMVSRELDRLAPNKALLLQSKIVGGIGDERPLRSTPLYEEKRSAETWRSDTLRQSAVLLDQPKAAIWLDGVNT